MELSSRPIIIARWIERDGQSHLETPRYKVVLDPKQGEAARLFYQQANGLTSIRAMFRGQKREQALAFYRQLEAIGMCYSAESVGMFGHKLSSFPDPHRPATNGREVLRLMILPPDPSQESIPLEGTLAPADLGRRTARQFSGQSIGFEHLSSLLLSAYGITSTEDSIAHRSVPSGGAMYPLEHHLIVLNCGGLESGHYRLCRHANALQMIGQDTQIGHCLFETDWQAAAAVHIIGFDIGRSAAKYGSRAYRFAMLEAGHAAQNAMRRAVELGLGSWEYGGYLDKELEEFCGLTEPSAGIATMLMYGGKP